MSYDVRISRKGTRGQVCLGWCGPFSSQSGGSGSPLRRAVAQRPRPGDREAMRGGRRGLRSLYRCIYPAARPKTRGANWPERGSCGIQRLKLAWARAVTRCGRVIRPRHWRRGSGTRPGSGGQCLETRSCVQRCGGYVLSQEKAGCPRVRRVRPRSTTSLCRRPPLCVCPVCQNQATISVQDGCPRVALDRWRGGTGAGRRRTC